MSIYSTLADHAADGLADHLEAIGRQGITLETRVALLERVAADARRLLDEYDRACRLTNAPRSEAARSLDVLLVDLEIARHA